MLYTGVKFPAVTASTLQKLYFVVFCKMASTHCILYRDKQVVVEDLGCELVGEEQSIPFLGLPRVCAS
jgi:hypothetical protein